MQIFGTDAYRTALSESISHCRDSVTLVSAYMTIEGIEWVLGRLPSQVRCRGLTRWSCSDLVSGASDLAVYEKLNSRGYNLYVLPDLHAKVIVIDEKELYLGSANITNSGLKLVPGGNREIGTILTPDEQDLSLMDALFNDAVLIDRQIYDMFCVEVQRLKDSCEAPLPEPKWSSDLMGTLSKPPQRIWVAETLWCASPNDIVGVVGSTDYEVVHDCALLGLDNQNEIGKKDLRQSFLKSRAWLWLHHKLQLMPNREIYYGQLSAKLHESFLDDPKPYRRNVKGLLTNLLNWSTSLCPDLILIDNPNHSQRIRLIS